MINLVTKIPNVTGVDKPNILETNARPKKLHVPNAEGLVTSDLYAGTYPKLHKRDSELVA